jgi:hypothetical protein
VAQATRRYETVRDGTRSRELRESAARTDGRENSVRRVAASGALWVGALYRVVRAGRERVRARWSTSEEVMSPNVHLLDVLMLADRPAILGQLR